MAALRPNSQGWRGFPLNSPLLEACGIVRRDAQNGNLLLNEAGLRIDAGECLSLSGPSGAGKTLLLRACAHLDPVESGQVLWQGQALKPTDIPAFRAKVMYLPQRSAMFPGDVARNLALGFGLGEHRHKAYPKKRVEEYLAQLGRNAEFLRKESQALSGGERQIVAFLRALILGPTVLLLDEAAAALDQETARQLADLVRGWLDEGEGTRAAVWVSHDPIFLARVATRAVILARPMGGSL